MNCEQTAEELSAYLDGELPDYKTRLVQAHLEGCTACAAELRSLQNATALVAANVLDLEPHPEIWHKVRARLSRRPVSPPRESWLSMFLGWRRWALATAAMIALTVGIWGYLRYQNAQEDLNQYMSRYIQARDMQEQMREEVIEPARNPFSMVNFSPEENPFRAEDR